MTLFFFLLVSFAQAIENLPCQTLLQPTGRPADEIVLSGRLEAYWETGMEDQTGWSIVDEQTGRWLSANPYDSLFWMKPGDYVELFWSGGEMARGYYHEEGFPRRPRLRDKDGRDVMDPRAFARAFFERAEARVTRKVAADELEEMNRRYALWFKVHERLKDKRMIDVGNGKIFEAAYFQTLARGEVIVKSDGRLALKAPQGEADMYLNDRLFISVDGETHEFEIDAFPYRGNEKLRDLIDRPHRAVLIR